MEEIQTWWEIPCIAHFCSLFRAAFNLLDFDIEDLEEGLLEGEDSVLIHQLLLRLIQGCLPEYNIDTYNWQFYMKRLFRFKCLEDATIQNPLSEKTNFYDLSLRKRVSVLQLLCDLRLESEDVLDLLKNLESDSLRVEPLGHDDSANTFWYFYGTRLYKESVIRSSNKHRWRCVCRTAQDWKSLAEQYKNATSPIEKDLYRTLNEDFLPEIPRLFFQKNKLQKKMQWISNDSICQNKDISDKTQYTPKQAETSIVSSSSSTSDHKSISQVSTCSSPLSSEKMRRKRANELESLKTSTLSNSLTDIAPLDPKSDDDHQKPTKSASKRVNTTKTDSLSSGHSESVARTRRPKRPKEVMVEVDSEEERRIDCERKQREQFEQSHREKLREEAFIQRAIAMIETRCKQNQNSEASDLTETSRTSQSSPSQQSNRRSNASKRCSASSITTTTHSSSMSSCGADRTSTYCVRKLLKKKSKPLKDNLNKIKSSAIIMQSDDELFIGMYKVLEAIKSHDDAWPFLDPVPEQFAPNYYSVIRRPMDLNTIESKLDDCSYKNREQFEADFRLIVDNCKLYNGIDNEYTEMVLNLNRDFNKLTKKFLDIVDDGNDEEDIYIDMSQMNCNTGSSTYPARSPNTSYKPPVTKTSQKSKRGSKNTNKTNIQARIVKGRGRPKRVGSNVSVDYSDDELLLETPSRPHSKEDTERMFDNLLKTSSVNHARHEQKSPKEQHGVSRLGCVHSSASDEETDEDSPKKAIAQGRIFAAKVRRDKKRKKHAHTQPDEDKFKSHNSAKQINADKSLNEHDLKSIRRSSDEPKQNTDRVSAVSASKKELKLKRKMLKHDKYSKKKETNQLLTRTKDTEDSNKGCNISNTYMNTSLREAKNTTTTVNSIKSLNSVKNVSSSEKLHHKSKSLFNSKDISKEESAKLEQLISRVRDNKACGRNSVNTNTWSHSLTMGKIIDSESRIVSGEEAWEELVGKRLRQETTELEEPLRLIDEPQEGNELPVLKKSATPNLSAWFKAFKTTASTTTFAQSQSQVTASKTVRSTRASTTSVPSPVQSTMSKPKSQVLAPMLCSEIPEESVFLVVTTCNMSCASPLTVTHSTHREDPAYNDEVLEKARLHMKERLEKKRSLDPSPCSYHTSSESEKSPMTPNSPSLLNKPSELKHNGASKNHDDTVTPGFYQDTASHVSALPSNCSASLLTDHLRLFNQCSLGASIAHTTAQHYVDSFGPAAASVCSASNHNTHLPWSTNGVSYFKQITSPHMQLYPHHHPPTSPVQSPQVPAVSQHAPAPFTPGALALGQYPYLLSGGASRPDGVAQTRAPQPAHQSVSHLVGPSDMYHQYYRQQEEFSLLQQQAAGAAMMSLMSGYRAARPYHGAAHHQQPSHAHQLALRQHFTHPSGLNHRPQFF